MSIPAPVFEPPFRITRASHVTLTVKDLARSRAFYTEIVGLVPTAKTADALYLRGIEEACHHSLVLRKGDTPECACIGMRVLTESDLDRAWQWLESEGHAPAWANVAFQGRTLRFTDAAGVPIELCAQMPVEPRMLTKFSSWRGGAAQRIDHYQMHTPDVLKATAFYVSLGFKLTEYIAPPGPFAPLGVFLSRKGNPHDIVFLEGAGPRIHHFAYVVPEVHHILTACDIAGEMGYGAGIERGPGRHGPGHATFIYIRDPDGHRVELFNTHYQVMDMENEPVRWDPRQTLPWGLPAQRTWFDEATPFTGAPVTQPEPGPGPMTLERYLAAKSG
ncbi:MAG: VOC family protein [Hyphomicrobiaceae bacterium]